MYVFLFLAIPTVLVWFMLSVPGYRWTAFVPPLLWGFFVAVIVCCIKEFFIFSIHVYTQHFLTVFFYILVHDTLLPVLLLSALFFCISQDDWDYKTASLFPLLGGFYLVFLPYGTVTGAEPYAFFFNFVKPVLILAMCAAVCALGRLAARAPRNIAPLYITAATLCLLAPPAIEGIWYFASEPTRWLAAGVFFALAGTSLLLCTMSRRFQVSAA